MKRKQGRATPSRQGEIHNERPRVLAHLRVDDPCTYNLLEDVTAEVTR